MDLPITDEVNLSVELRYRRAQYDYALAQAEYYRHEIRRLLAELDVAIMEGAEAEDEAGGDGGGLIVEERYIPVHDVTGITEFDPTGLELVPAAFDEVYLDLYDDNDLGFDDDSPDWADIKERLLPVEALVTATVPPRVQGHTVAPRRSYNSSPEL